MRARSRTAASRAMLLPAGGFDQPVPVGVGGGLGPVRAARLAQDRADVVRGGVLADGQVAADLAVAQAFGDEREDLDLAEGEPVGWGGGRAVRADAALQGDQPDPPRELRRLGEQRRTALAADQPSVLV